MGDVRRPNFGHDWGGVLGIVYTKLASKHFEQFTLQCHLVDYSNECPFAKFSDYNSWMLLYTCAMKPIFHVMITCPASFSYCKFLFGILFAAPSSVSMRIQVYFQGVLGGLCLDNQFTFKHHLLDECTFLFWKCLH